jgi:ABC-type oligopeptide transport system substrate-binding subunit
MPRTARDLTLVLLLLTCFFGAGCTHRTEAARPALRWIVAQPPPPFDPAGPPDAVQWTFLRLLGRGLTTLDSTGKAVPDAAERVEVARDGRTVTFHFTALRFADGSSCTSADFARALRTALARKDHTTARWLLRAVEGVPAIRSGRPLP